MALRATFRKLNKWGRLVGFNLPVNGHDLVHQIVIPYSYHRSGLDAITVEHSSRMDINPGPSVRN